MECHTAFINNGNMYSLTWKDTQKRHISMYGVLPSSHKFI